MSNNELSNMLSSTEISNRDKLLLILNAANGKPLQSADVKKLAIESGLHEAENWNVSDSLTKANGLAVKVKDGWVLANDGKRYIKESHLSQPSSAKIMSTELRVLLSTIKNTDSQTFVKEAISCLEVDAYKAAVVFIWIGAISVLYDFVIANHLSDFNREANRRDAKWKPATNRDDLTRMKESDFLDILGALSILNKNVKEHLKNTNLNFRNSCGHPNSIKVGKLNVEAHIEFLAQNVFAIFS